LLCAEREKMLLLLLLHVGEGVAGRNIPLKGVPEDGCTWRLHTGGVLPLKG
jgi:hypothetical protein